MTVTKIDRWLEPRQTDNAVLLEGYLCGALTAVRDPLYRIVERREADGGTTIEHRESGNRYLLKTVQISGTE